MDEERAASEVRETRSEYGEQDEWGNDVDQLRENLKLTPYERLVKADHLHKSMIELRNAFQRSRSNKTT